MPGFVGARESGEKPHKPAPIVRLLAPNDRQLHGTISVEYHPQSPYNARARTEDGNAETRQRCTGAGQRHKMLKQPGASIKRPPVHRITLAQIAVLVVVCTVVAMFDVTAAYSAAIGGLIAVGPQAWFAARLFRKRGARSADAVARSGYAGEVGKFLLTAAGFAVVFSTVHPLNPMAVFVAFIAMLAMQITGSWLLLRRWSAN